MLDPGARILGLDPGFRIRDRVQDPGSGLDPGSRVQDPGGRVQSSGSRALVPGAWIPDPESRIPGTGSEARIHSPGSRVLDHDLKRSMKLITELSIFLFD